MTTIQSCYKVTKISDGQIFLNFMTNASKGESASNIGEKKQATITAIERADMSNLEDELTILKKLL